MNEHVELDGQLKGFVLGPKMLACSKRERIFAFALATNIAANGAEAARLAGYPDKLIAKNGKPSNSLRSRAHQVLHRPRVMEAVEEVCRAEFRNLVPLVIGAAKRVLLDPDHKDHVRMIVSLLSRLGYGERAAVDVSVSGTVTVSHADAAVEDLARLKELGVPHEKLVEVFGFSGLGRYQALLEEREARRPKLIEHAPLEATDG